MADGRELVAEGREEGQRNRRKGRTGGRRLRRNGRRGEELLQRVSTVSPEKRGSPLSPSEGAATILPH